MVPANHPHVLLLVTDDQGAWALGSKVPELHTPTLDRLQSEGTTLDHFFCASPVCSPARASMMTGRMPSAHGVHDWIRPEGLARTESPQRPYKPEFLETMTGADSISKMLSRSGYRCGMVGKWHVGSADRPAEGFDYWYAHQLGGGPYYNAPIWEQNEHTGVPEPTAKPATEPEYLTDAITRQSLDFLRRHSAEGDSKPFFLQINWTAPHTPWFDGNHPQELTDLYAETDFPTVPVSSPHPWFKVKEFARAVEDRRGALTGYFAAISGVDRSIATIVDYLETSGQLDDTIIVFTSDNGFSCGHHGIWGKGNGTSPLNFWEPSIKVPFIVRWPGKVQAGATDDKAVSATSLLETLGELTGARPLPDPLRAGRSIASRLLGDEDVSEAHGPVVIHDEYGANRMIRTGRWKLVVRLKGPTELYDLQEDPGEEQNLSSDPVYAERLGELRSELESWFDRHATEAFTGWVANVDGNGQTVPVI